MFTNRSFYCNEEKFMMHVRELGECSAILCGVYFLQSGCHLGRQNPSHLLYQAILNLRRQP